MKTLARNQIILDHGNLPEGGHLAGQLCPKCEGGRTREYSLSVTMTGGALKWMCHRASCAFAGVHQMSAASRVAAPSPSPIRRRSVRFEGHPLDQGTLDYLESSFLINKQQAEEFGLQWTEARSDSGKGRVVIPIRSRDFSLRGHVLRAIDSSDAPKGISSWDGSGTGAWFNRPGSDKLVIVEDCYSAIRASQYVNSFALLGTHISSDTIDELKESGLTKVYLALDKDALNISIAHVAAHKNKLPIKVVPLKKDIKNMTHEELEELVNDL